MSDATPQNIDVNEEDLGGLVGYDEFKPGEYVGTLTAVQDVTATKTGNYGWRWTFQVEGLDFNITTWLKGGGLWKLEELITAMGGELRPGAGQMIDPNMYIGSQAGVRIDKDATAQDERYRDRLTILRTFPVAGIESRFEVPDTF